jgi:hypothetical protein
MLNGEHSQEVKLFCLVLLPRKGKLILRRAVVESWPVRILTLEHV